MVEAAVRRHRRIEMPTIESAASSGELTVRSDLHQAFVGEKSLELTAREFEILQLLSGSDRVLRREEIYERVRATRWPAATGPSTCSCASCARSSGSALPSGPYPHSLWRRLPVHP